MWAALLAEFLGLCIFQIYGGSANDDVAALANGITLAVIGRHPTQQQIKPQKNSPYSTYREPGRKKGGAIAVYATANVSGGHLNPSVTFANCLTGHMSWSKGGVYVVAQFLGSIFGALVEVTTPISTSTNRPTFLSCLSCSLMSLFTVRHAAIITSVLLALLAVYQSNPELGN